MKTNVVMESPNRQLFGVQVRQETKTQFLNLSDLQSVYDTIRVSNGWTKKTVQDLFRVRENLERIYHLLLDTGKINSTIFEFIEQIEKEGATNTLKKLGVYKTTGKGATKTTYCDPYIWVLAAMEMNPAIYAKVIIWLTDKLIFNRIEAGELYKGLTKQLSKWQNPSYAKIAIKINEIVFGEHFAGIRNTATEKQLKEISEIEKFAAGLIECDYISSEQQLFSHLEMVQKKKQNISLNP